MAPGLTRGKHLGGLAAAGVYRAGHEHGQLYSQVELAEHAGVTPATVRKRRAELQEHVD